MAYWLCDAVCSILMILVVARIGVLQAINSAEVRLTQDIVSDADFGKLYNSIAAQ